MQPRREEFILDVRRAARDVQKPNVVADSEMVNGNAIARVLQRAAFWLTPKVVEHYQADEFADMPSELRDQLHRSVIAFRELASQAPPDQPATKEQFAEGLGRFRRLTEVLGKIVRDEWLLAIEALVGQAEKWSADSGWRTRRVAKELSETLLGPYRATQLLIFAEPHLYVLDPVARFVPGALGAFDFAIQPSYSLTSLYRDYSGAGHVQVDVGQGPSKGHREEWGPASFRKCVEESGRWSPRQVRHSS